MGRQDFGISCAKFFVAVVGLKDHWHKLCKKRLNEMAQWDEKNKKDVAEYERLKKKFGDD